MSRTFQQVEWTAEVERAARILIRLAIAEDVADQGDWTTNSLVPETARATVAVASRSAGVLAGMPIAALTLEETDANVQLDAQTQDGQRIDAGQPLAVITGAARSILTAERTLLNFLGRLSGIATLTRQYVDAVQHTRAQVYDTRKTTPGWRLLEKYAVRCGGGFNHRLGLHKAVMIKDNHVAMAAEGGLDLPAAIEKVRKSLAAANATVEALEVEVDTVDQLRAVLPMVPDIVLLDNMQPAELTKAVELRNRLSPSVVLEASGGVNLQTIGGIAETGVDRLSVGALTHSAVGLDLGLDWRD